MLQFLPLDSMLPAVLLAGGAYAAYSLYNRSRMLLGNGEARMLENCNLLLGDIPELLRNASRIHDWLAETSLRFNGDPWHVYLPGVYKFLILTKPELVEEVFITQFENFERGKDTCEGFEDLFGRNLMSSNGEKWFHQRKAALKFFTARSLRVCMTTYIRRNMTQVYDVIDRETAAGTPIDLLKLFHEFGLQTFAEIGFGIDLNVIGSDELHPLEKMVEDVAPTIMRREGLPNFFWKLERWLKIGPEGKVEETMRPVREWLNKLAHESLEAAQARRAKPQNPDEEEIKSIVELFLDQSSEDKTGLRAQDLVDFILAFILGSYGTTGLTLVWVFLMLTKHPEVEQKIRDEMEKVLPDLAPDAYVTDDMIQGLVYLEATIKEVLRLYPTVPINIRSAVRDTVIGNGIKIKAGETMIAHPFTVARLPNVWGPDAAEFKPERWIDPATGRLISVSSTKWNAFSSGPRICVGMKLALLEMRVVFVNLLRRYKFELAEPNDCGYVLSIELKPKSPVMVVAKRI